MTFEEMKAKYKQQAQSYSTEPVAEQPEQVATDEPSASFDELKRKYKEQMPREEKIKLTEPETVVHQPQEGWEVAREKSEIRNKPFAENLWQDITGIFTFPFAIAETVGKTIGGRVAEEISPSTEQKKFTIGKGEKAREVVQKDEGVSAIVSTDLPAAKQAIETIAKKMAHTAGGAIALSPLVNDEDESFMTDFTNGKKLKWGELKQEFYDDLYTNPVTTLAMFLPVAQGMGSGVGKLAKVKPGGVAATILDSGGDPVYLAGKGLKAAGQKYPGLGKYILQPDQMVPELADIRKKYGKDFDETILKLKEVTDGLDNDSKKLLLDAVKDPEGVLRRNAVYQMKDGRQLRIDDVISQYKDTAGAAKFAGEVESFRLLPDVKKAEPIVMDGAVVEQPAKKIDYVKAAEQSPRFKEFQDRMKAVYDEMELQDKHPDFIKKYMEEKTKEFIEQEKTLLKNQDSFFTGAWKKREKITPVKPQENVVKTLDKPELIVEKLPDNVEDIAARVETARNVIMDLSLQYAKEGMNTETVMKNLNNYVARFYEFSKPNQRLGRKIVGERMMHRIPEEQLTPELQKMMLNEGKDAPFILKSTAATMMTDLFNIKTFNEIAHTYKGKLVFDTAETAPKNFVKMPSVRVVELPNKSVFSYGDLAGKYVHPNVFNYVDGIFNYTKQEQGALGNILTQWKKNMTVRNLPTHVFNTATNFNLWPVYASTHDGSGFMSGGIKVMANTVKAFKKPSSNDMLKGKAGSITVSELWNKLEAKGIDRSSVVENVIEGGIENALKPGDLSKKIQQYAADRTTNFFKNPIRSGIKAFKTLDRGLTWAYRAEDDFFKVAATLDQIINKGKSIDDAWEIATNFYPDYSKQPLITKMLSGKNNFWSAWSPFITYHYFIAPKAIHFMFEKPAHAFALSQLSKSIDYYNGYREGLSKGETDWLRGSLPSYLTGSRFSGFHKITTKDEDGKNEKVSYLPTYYSLTRSMPLSGLIAKSNEFEGDMFKGTALDVGHPFLTIAAGVLTGYDPFLRDMYRTQYEEGSGIASKETAWWATKRLIPSMLGWGAEKVSNIGVPDKLGRIREGDMVALDVLLGFKFSPIDVENVEQRRASKFMRGVVPDLINKAKRDIMDMNRAGVSEDKIEARKEKLRKDIEYQQKIFKGE